MPEITITRLRKIIKEELEMLREGDAEEQGAIVMRACSDLIKAIEKFGAIATSKAKSATDGAGDSLEKRLKSVEKTLKRITDLPKDYVDGPKQPEASLKSSIEPAPVAPVPGAKKVSVQPNVKKA
jgi:hypothetical protein